MTGSSCQTGGVTSMSANQVYLMLESLVMCLNLRGLGPGYAPLVMYFLQAAAGMVLLALFFRRQVSLARG